jgi:pimeloyl-ACP methyl ester carboxylesterase
VSAPRSGLLGVGVLAAGAAVGSAVERRLMGQPLKAAAAQSHGYGSVHAPPIVVTADDGVELYVEIDEPRPGAAYEELTVVFTHGYALNLDCWHHQRLALSGAARCVYWDQRGHGRSGRGEPGPVEIDRLGQDLASVLAAVAPTGPVVLVGHSMGGMTVMALAAAEPELFLGGEGDGSRGRVVGAALMSTSAGKMAEVTLGVPAAAARLLHRAAPGVMAVLGRAPRLVELGRRTGSDLEFALTRIYSFSSDVPPAAVDFVAQMNAGTPIEVIADFFGAFDVHDKFDALPALASVPTLVMVGDSDLLTPMGHSEEILAAVPSVDLVVLPNCGHMLMIEYPDLVSAELRALLDRALAVSQALGRAQTEP